MSCIQGFALMSLSVRLLMQTLVRLSMQSSVGRDLCQFGLTACLCTLSLTGLLFMGGDDVSPTFLICINFYLEIREAQVNSALGQRGDLPLVVAASLDCYEGTQSMMWTRLLAGTMMPTS
jgi:hypothetical protein